MKLVWRPPNGSASPFLNHVHTIMRRCTVEIAIASINLQDHRARISQKLELEGHHALLRFALERQASLWLTGVQSTAFRRALYASR
jgi:hypothetical protein